MLLAVFGFCYNTLKSSIMATPSRTAHAANSEVTILARFLTNGDRPLPKHIARYILTLTIRARTGIAVLPRPLEMLSRSRWMS